MKYEVIQADYSEHRDAILKLWHANLPSLTVSRFEWFYEENPNGTPHTWLVQEVGSGEFVGCCSIFPRFFVIDDERRKAGIASDFAINRDHRVLGPAIKLQRAVAKDYEDLGYDFILGWPNRLSTPVFKRLGYQKLGASLRLARPFSIRGKAFCCTRNSLFGGLFCKVADMVLFLTTRLLVLFYATRYSYHNVTSEESNILETLTDDGGYTRPVCSADFAKWRYLSNPSEQSGLLLIRNKKNGQIAGQCAFSIDDVNNVMDILDIVVTDGKKYKSVMVVLLKFALQKKIKSVSITFFGFGPIVNIFRGLGFVSRQEDRSLYFYLSPERSSVVCFEEQIRKKPLLLFDGDLDV